MATKNGTTTSNKASSLAMLTEREALMVALRLVAAEKFQQRL